MIVLDHDNPGTARPSTWLKKVNCDGLRTSNPGNGLSLPIRKHVDASWRKSVVPACCWGLDFPVRSAHLFFPPGKTPLSLRAVEAQTFSGGGLICHIHRTAHQWVFHKQHWCHGLGRVASSSLGHTVVNALKGCSRWKPRIPCVSRGSAKPRCLLHPLRSCLRQPEAAAPGQSGSSSARGTERARAQYAILSLIINIIVNTSTGADLTITVVQGVHTFLCTCDGGRPDLHFNRCTPYW